MEPLTPNQILALIWTLNAIAIILTTGRLYIRKKVIKKVYWDDALHCFALLLCINEIALATASNSNAKQAIKYDTKETTTPPNWKFYHQINVAVTINWFCCIWTVKLAFMVFYRTLFRVSEAFMRAWWAVLVFTILSFWICIALTLTQCGGKPSNLINHDVCYSVSSIKFQKNYFKVILAINVASDIFIMALPISMLPGLHIRNSQKLGIAGLFCLTFIAIAFDIIRTVESLSGTGSSLNTLWTNLETAITVIISCLPTYNTVIFHPRRHFGAQNMLAYNTPAASPRRNQRSESPKTSTDNQNESIRTQRSRDGSSQDLELGEIENRSSIQLSRES